MKNVTDLNKFKGKTNDDESLPLPCSLSDVDVAQRVARGGCRTDVLSKAARTEAQRKAAHGPCRRLVVW